MEGENLSENNQVLVAVATLTADIKNIHEKLDKISSVHDKVIKIDQRVENAHEKIKDNKDDSDKAIQLVKDDYCEKIRALNDKFEKLDGNITWVWRTIAGAVLVSVVGAILVL